MTRSETRIAKLLILCCGFAAVLLIVLSGCQSASTVGDSTTAPGKIATAEIARDVTQAHNYFPAQWDPKLGIHVT